MKPSIAAIRRPGVYVLRSGVGYCLVDGATDDAGTTMAVAK
jgi:hypothetical protein